MPTEAYRPLLGRDAPCAEISPVGCINKFKSGMMMQVIGGFKIFPFHGSFYVPGISNLTVALSPHTDLRVGGGVA